MRHYLVSLVVLLGAVACTQRPPTTANDPSSLQAQKPQAPYPSQDAPAAATAPGDAPSSRSGSELAQPASPAPGGSPAPSPAPSVPSSTRSGGTESPSPSVPNGMPQPDPL